MAETRRRCCLRVLVCSESFARSVQGVVTSRLDPASLNKVGARTDRSMLAFMIFAVLYWMNREDCWHASAANRADGKLSVCGLRKSHLYGPGCSLLRGDPIDCAYWTDQRDVNVRRTSHGTDSPSMT